MWVVQAYLAAIINTEEHLLSFSQFMSANSSDMVIVEFDEDTVLNGSLMTALSSLALRRLSQAYQQAIQLNQKRFYQAKYSEITQRLNW